MTPSDKREFEKLVKKGIGCVLIPILCILVIVVAGFFLNDLKSSVDEVAECEPVEKVVWQTTDQPCIQWEITYGGEIGHPAAGGGPGGRGFYLGTTPQGWEPIGVPTTRE